MSRVWLTSDLHIGHERVATDHRPFGSVEEHDATLAHNWRSRVTKRDVVYVLGDLAVGGLDSALALVASLPGIKHFISGNHDACHPLNRRWRSALPRFLGAFDTVQPFGTIRYQGREFLLSHFPYSDDHTDPPRHMQWRLPNHGKWLLHGHTHDATQTLHGHEVHVGVDAWGFAPVALDAIHKLVEASEMEDTA